MYLNKDKIGGFAKNYYWSSTEGNGSNTWEQRFSEGKKFLIRKDNYIGVRAVRAF
jgi:hypothetical protein